MTSLLAPACQRATLTSTSPSRWLVALCSLDKYFCYYFLESIVNILNFLPSSTDVSSFEHTVFQAVFQGLTTSNGSPSTAQWLASSSLSTGIQILKKNSALPAPSYILSFALPLTPEWENRGEIELNAFPKSSNIYPFTLPSSKFLEIKYTPYWLHFPLLSSRAGWLSATSPLILFSTRSRWPLHLQTQC